MRLYRLPIMPRDAVSRTENVERNGGHKWVKEATSRQNNYGIVSIY